MNAVNLARQTGISPTRGQSLVTLAASGAIPDDLQATNDETLQMVWGPGTFGPR